MRLRRSTSASSATSMRKGRIVAPSAAVACSDKRLAAAMAAGVAGTSRGAGDVSGMRFLRRWLCSHRLAQRPERGTQLGTEELRLFPGGEVSAFVDLVVVDEFGIGAFRPAPRRFVLFAREDGYGDRNLDALGVEKSTLVFPIEARG